MSNKEHAGFVAFENAIKILESEQKYIQAFDYVEQMVEIMKKDQTTSQESLQNFVINHVQNASKHANDLLCLGKQKTSLKLLKKAEQLIKTDGEAKQIFAPSRILIYNTMACLYKDMNRLTLALSNLEKAIEIAKSFNVLESMGITYLNKSAILSLIGNHKEAKTQAELGALNTNKEIEEIKKTKNDAQLLKKKEALLGFAYFNIGVQEEYLNNVTSALSYYEKAEQLTENNSETWL